MTGERVLALADVLEMRAVRSARPLVLAGSGHLDRPVRWVHTTELADIGPLLRGGDLVLTTGIAMPDSPQAWSRFARSLLESDAAGLFVELGRRWTTLPESLVDSCEALGLPLVALRREVRFAAVAQEVGERLVDEQVAELREAQRVHDVFTELSIGEAEPKEIIAAVQQLSGATVVHESAQHRVLDYRAGPEDVAAFLDDWERRSRSVELTERTAWDEGNGWLVTRVGRRERRWGRLVIGSPAAPPRRLVAVAERAAAALAMHRLHDRNRDSQARRLHHELLVGLLANPTDSEIARRAQLAGIAVEGRQYVGLALRPGTDRPAPGRPAVEDALAIHRDELVASCLHSARVLGIPALVAAFETDVRALLSLPAAADPVHQTDRFAEHVQSRSPVVAAAGTTVGRLHSADRTLREATHLLASLPERRRNAAVHRLEDIHVRGLLTLLADDERLRTFARRQLAPLREATDRIGAELLQTARVVVEHWGSKSTAAARLNVSRPVLYDRIARIERLLGADLGDAEVRTSLHVALLSEDVR